MVLQSELKKIRQSFVANWKQLKRRPETVISLIAVILLVIGAFSAVLLSSVEQDIRQQAQTSNDVYNVSSKDLGCGDVPSGKIGCIDSSNQRVVCDGNKWRYLDQSCDDDQFAIPPVPIVEGERICTQETCEFWVVNY